MGEIVACWCGAQWCSRAGGLVGRGLSIKALDVLLGAGAGARLGGDREA